MKEEKRKTVKQLTKDLSHLSQLVELFMFLVKTENRQAVYKSVDNNLQKLFYHFPYGPQHTNTCTDTFTCKDECIKVNWQKRLLTSLIWTSICVIILLTNKIALHFTSFHSVFGHKKDVRKNWKLRTSEQALLLTIRSGKDARIPFSCGKFIAFTII